VGAAQHGPMPPLARPERQARVISWVFSILRTWRSHVRGVIGYCAVGSHSLIDRFTVRYAPSCDDRVAGGNTRCPNTGIRAPWGRCFARESWTGGCDQ
jgi:hypothetical protein